MLLTTTNNLDGIKIEQYIGIVTGETIIGANIFRDWFANIRDVIGGRSGTYERVLRKAKDVAIQEMTQEAIALGANAIIGIDLDYENLGRNGGMLMVVATGTAVYVGEKNYV